MTSTRPKPFFVVIANRPQLGYARLGRRRYLSDAAQRPAGIVEHILYFDSRMHGSKISLAILAKAKNSFRSDHRRRASAGQSYMLAPRMTIAISWAGEK